MSKRIFCNFNGCYSKRSRSEANDVRLPLDTARGRSPPSSFAQEDNNLHATQVDERTKSNDPLFTFRGDMEQISKYPDFPFRSQESASKARDLLISLLSRLRQRKDLTAQVSKACNCNSRFWQTSGRLVNGRLILRF